MTQASAAASAWQSTSSRDAAARRAGSMRLALAAALACAALAALAAERPISRPELKQGSEFVSAEVRAMQADELANPGMLWVTRGERLWRDAPREGAKACAGCHGDAPASMKGVA